MPGRFRLNVSDHPEALRARKRTEEGVMLGFYIDYGN